MDKKYSEYLDSLYNELDLKIKELNSLILNDKQPDAEKNDATDSEKKDSESNIKSIDINSEIEPFKKI